MTSLRERKKQQTREMLATQAKVMFAERSFEQVTVAEIADAANISVKTLFKYFRTKEDLFFSDIAADLDAEILAAVRGRKVGESAFEAIEGKLHAMIFGSATGTVVGSLERFRRTIESSPTLKAGLAAVWERFEQTLTHQLRADTSASPGDLRPALAAAQLAALIRVFTTGEFALHLASVAEARRGAALKAAWREAGKSVADGIRTYAIRQR